VDSSDTNLSDILSALEVRPGGIVYVHSSAEWIQRGGVDIRTALSELRAALGPDATLVLPALPYSPPLEDFLATSPVVDLQRTPTRAGLLAEIFRRSPETRRTFDPDVSLSVGGPESDWIVGETPCLGWNPFGPHSPYRRILSAGAYVLGLGVSRNTMGLVHVIDSLFADRYPIDIYCRKTMQATSIDENGQRLVYYRRPVRREVDLNIKPERLVPEGRRRRIFREVQVNGAFFFAWDLQSWKDLAMEHARKQVENLALPVWLSDVPPAESEHYS
jgi:aminoglycoside N3'-acetyltransferase